MPATCIGSANAPKLRLSSSTAVPSPEGLIESELFGHERGAFTGATTASEGRFREANGGTVFLDEIGELPLLLQTRLLRVLQEKTVQPIGARGRVPVDVQGDLRDSR